MSTVAVAEPQAVTGVERPPIHSFHHPAIKCFDAEETRKFYEDVLGLPLNAAVVINDDGRGGDYYFMHIFFRMADGDFIAFFDKDSEIKPDLFKPYGRDDFRLGLRVGSEAELADMEKRLKAAGVDYSGPFDDGFVKSIYFRDPNHLHVEVSLPAANHQELMAKEKTRAKDVLADWTKKTAAKKEEYRQARAAQASEAPAGAVGY